MSFEVPIERGKVREFARSVHADPGNHARNGAPIPPTFLTTARLTWASSDQNPLNSLGFDRSRLLHAGEEYRFFGELPRVGQVLNASSSIAEQYSKSGKRGGTMRFAVIVTEFSDASGDVVAEQRTTYVETAKPPKEE